MPLLGAGEDLCSREVRTPRMAKFRRLCRAVSFENTEMTIGSLRDPIRFRGDSGREEKFDGRKAEQRVTDLELEEVLFYGEQMTDRKCQESKLWLRALQLTSCGEC